ncbi:3-hydroxyacyl-ACP dehydratase FabZ family protein [Actinokineospora guangxiensis]|uniref:3-hydroxyacyl-ACP dehydratase FabZ family protein n=1 Tax=Actinokineospora guangxiensis TaxID=1490288 RepID=A0ABW0EM79_9PSEU
MSGDPTRILAALPHRYPMLMVDRVLTVEPGKRLTAVKAVTFAEPWYDGAGADTPPEDLAYPHALLLESWGQAAGLLGSSCPETVAGLDGVMLLGGAAGVRFHRPVHPGDVLVHDVRLSRALSDTLVFAGESRVDGALVFEVERMIMAFRPAALLRAEPVPGPERSTTWQSAR